MNLSSTFGLPSLRQHGGIIDVTSPISPPSLSSDSVITGTAKITIPTGGVASLDGAEFMGQNDVEVESGGTMDWSNVRMEGTGSTTATIDAGATLDVTSGGILDQELDNHGTVSFSGADNFVHCASDGRGKFLNYGQLTFAGLGGIFESVVEGCVFTNEAGGTVTQAAGASAVTLGGRPSNAGTIAASGGTMTLENDTTNSGSGTQMSTSTGTFRRRVGCDLGAVWGPFSLPQALRSTGPARTARVAERQGAEREHADRRSLHGHHRRRPQPPQPLHG